MGNIVKLVFQAIATGSGFGKLLGEVKGLNEKMPGLSKAAQIVGTSFGTAGAAAGRMVGMLLQGGIWGVAAEGAKLLIDQLGLFKDKSAETKEKLDKLEESTRKFYETINSNTGKAIEKIDAETKRRNEQLDITNRMIKAELQLQKAKAISNGDAKWGERIDEQLAKADRTTSMDNAVGAERDASSRVKTAEAGLSAAQKAEREANANLAKAEAAYRNAKENSFYVTGSNGVHQKHYTEPEEEKAAVEAARKRLALAEQATDVAQKSVDAEREKWRLAKEGVKALKAEQEAAEAEAQAKKDAAWKKELSDRIAADKKALAEYAAAERKKNEEIAKEKRRRAIEALQEEIRKRNEERKKDLQKDIEANRQRAASLEQALGDAMERVRETHDVLGNAANMDQAADVAENRRETLTNARYAERAIALQNSKKVRNVNGEWVANRRLSNIDQAVLERLNAENNKKNVEKEQDKVVKKLDELINKLEQMSTL